MYQKLVYTVGQPGLLARPGLSVVYNHRELGRQGRGGLDLFAANDPSIEQVYDTSTIPGFEGTDLVRGYAEIEVDARNNPRRTSQGVHFLAFGGGLPPQAGYAYGQYGAELVGYINLYKHTRVLLLRAAFEALHGDDSRIPFTDLPKLGGSRRLRGYRLGRFRDKQAMIATVEYHYPIHQLVNGQLFFDFGRVASSYQEMFGEDIGLWRRSFGGGFGIHNAKRRLFSIDIAYGEALLLYLTTKPLQAFVNQEKRL